MCHNIYYGFSRDLHLDTFGHKPLTFLLYYVYAYVISDYTLMIL